MDSYYKQKYQKLVNSINAYYDLAIERLEKENNKLIEYDEGFNDAIKLLIDTIEELDNE